MCEPGAGSLGDRQDACTTNPWHLPAFLRLTTARLAKKPIEHQRQQHPRAAEKIKPRPPSVLFRKPSPSPTSRNRADINAGLMEGKRARPGVTAMIVADQRHRGGKIKRLAESFQSADGDEVPKFAAPTGHDRDATPEQAAAQDQILALDSVADEPGERGAERIDPHEGGADQAQMNFVIAEFLLEFWEDGKDGLPVGIIEEADKPEHAHHPPFVAKARCFPCEAAFHRDRLIINDEFLNHNDETMTNPECQRQDARGPLGIWY